jgi:hypothetical protein
MCALPIVPGSEISTPVGGAQMDVNAFRSAALAPGRIAEAVGQDVGGVFQEVSQKIQANLNFKTVADADLKMRTAQADFDNWKKTNPDYKTWLPEWQTRSKDLEDTILNGPDVGPSVKRQLTQMFGVWDVSNASKTRTEALGRQVQESRMVALADSTMAYNSGGPSAIEDGDNILKAAVEHHGMTPVEAQIHMKAGRQTAIEAQANNIIGDDPIHAPERIAPLEGQVNAFKWRGMLRLANEAKSQQQTRNFNEWSEKLDQSLTHEVDPELLRADVTAGNIKQSHMNSLMTRMKTTADGATQAQAKQEKSEFDTALYETEKHDWTGDTNPEKTKSEMKANGLAWTSPALRMRLDQFVDSQASQGKRLGEQQMKPVQKAIFDQMEESRTHSGMTVPLTDETSDGFRIHNLVPGGLEGLRKLRDNPAEIKRMFGPNATYDKVAQAEQAYHAGIVAKMRDWFADPANKNATYEDANKYRIELEKPKTMEAMQRFLKPAPVSTYAKPEEVRDAVRSGKLDRKEAAKILKTQFGYGD